MARGRRPARAQQPGAASTPRRCGRSLLHLAGIQRELAARIPRCPGRSRSRKRQVFGRLQRARLYLEGNCDRVVRISELAELTSFSSWYFSKTFHALYDESPQAAAARMRLERAAELLRGTIDDDRRGRRGQRLRQLLQLRARVPRPLRRVRDPLPRRRARAAPCPRGTDSAKPAASPAKQRVRRSVSLAGRLTHHNNAPKTIIWREIDEPSQFAYRDAARPVAGRHRDRTACRPLPARRTPLRPKKPPPSTASRSPVRASARPTSKPRSRSADRPATTSSSRASQSVADILQNITAAGSPAISRTSPLATGEDVGGQYIDLRNLGANRTLVLVNGKRLGITTGGLQDVASIPAAMVERIEVLKDGASTIYGSDAIAGVVNIITRQNFEGAEANAYLGQYGKGDGTRQVYDFTMGFTGDRGSADRRRRVREGRSGLGRATAGSRASPLPDRREDRAASGWTGRPTGRFGDPAATPTARRLAT